MKRGGGARKGGSFEWKVARIVSLWLTGGHDDTQFVRSRQSGGWARNKSGRHSADLTANGEQGEAFMAMWMIEAKHYNTIDFWGCLTCQPSANNLLGWWRKLSGEAAILSGARLPLLVFRANNRPIMAASHPGIIRNLIIQNLAIDTAGVIEVRVRELAFAAVPLDTFLSLLPPVPSVWQEIRDGGR